VFTLSSSAPPFFYEESSFSPGDFRVFCLSPVTPFLTVFFLFSSYVRQLTFGRNAFFVVSTFPERVPLSPVTTLSSVLGMEPVSTKIARCINDLPRHFTSSSEVSCVRIDWKVDAFFKREIGSYFLTHPRRTKMSTVHPNYLSPPPC